MRQAALRMGSLSVFEDIPYTSHRFDQGRLPGAVDLSAQPVDVHIHNIGVRLDAHSPYLVEDHGPGNYTAGVSTKVLQQDEFLLRKLQHLSSAQSFPTKQIEFKILNADAGCLAGRWTVAFEQVAKPGKQFSQRERLGEIVVAALLQATHSIIHGAPRRENQNRRTNTQLSQAQYQGDAILIGKAEVNDQYVEGAFYGEAFGSFSIICGLNFISSLFQRTAKEGLNVDFIFH
jgi:hypothetical protein